MQGFNMGRYRPPDVDPRQVPFNTSSHPLGKRASKLSSLGILTVRFELPFSIWCGGCSSHIAQGVRFNAEKKHVDDYFSTKIWSFGCKCHLCGHRFVIRTDPKNARYVVTEGAKQQVRDWDPEQNGGFPIYDSEAASTNDAESSTTSKNPFAQLEAKESEKAQHRKRQKRISDLEAISSRSWKDPYTLNSSLRKSFRQEKRKRIAQLEKDIELRDRIGWHHGRTLIDPKDTSPDTSRKDAEEWKQGRMEVQRPNCSSGNSNRLRSSIASRPSLPSSSSSSSKPNPSPSTTKAKTKTAAVHRLRDTILANTRSRNDPFLQQVQRNLQSSSSSSPSYTPKK